MREPLLGILTAGCLLAGCAHGAATNTAAAPPAATAPATAAAPAAPEPPFQRGPRTQLFDGESLRGWSGKPEIWAVANGAIQGISEKGGGLIYADGEYGSFRLILKSRLASEKNHLGVCFWGARTPDWNYGECILVIPPTGGMWDYHPGKKGPPRERLPRPDFDAHAWHETEILADFEAGTIRMAVNGVEVTRYKDEDPKRLRKGPIGLQIHAGASVVEYKDIEVEPSPPDKRLVTLKPAAAAAPAPAAAPAR